VAQGYFELLQGYFELLFLSLSQKKRGGHVDEAQNGPHFFFFKNVIRFFEKGRVLMKETYKPICIIWVILVQKRPTKETYRRKLQMRPEKRGGHSDNAQMGLV